MNELINYEMLGIYIIISIISFILGCFYQLTYLYKKKTGKSIWGVNYSQIKNVLGIK